MRGRGVAQARRQTRPRSVTIRAAPSHRHERLARTSHGAGRGNPSRHTIAAKTPRVKTSCQAIGLKNQLPGLRPIRQD